MTEISKPLVERTYTLPEIMALLGCGRSTVYRMVSEGRLPSPTRFGRRTLWFRTSVDVGIESWRHKSERNINLR